LEENQTNDAIGHFKEQIEDLQRLMNEQKLAEQKLRAEHEEDKVSWNRQHQEHLFSVEVFLNYYHFNIKFYFKEIVLDACKSFGS